MSKSIITVENLTKKYNNTKVVNNISFDVKKGEVFGILGPNGAGKTTTLEMIESLRPIDSGKVTIDGIDVTEYPHKIKKAIGIQMQSTAFLELITLKEQLLLLASIYGSKIDPVKILKDVKLVDSIKKYPEQLSGGQRQRFAIASALVNSPIVLFLDEPTTGLDPQARRNLWKLIQDINKKGVTIVLTTHYMEEAELLCDRLAIMDEGKIIALDTPKALTKALTKRGFKKAKVIEQVNLEDVYIDLTGKAIRD